MEVLTRLQNPKEGLGARERRASLWRVHMTVQRRNLYTSPNGDNWYLCRERSGKLTVSHEPNTASGGKSSQVEIAEFIAKGNKGPEHQALLQLIGELVDPQHESPKRPSP